MKLVQNRLVGENALEHRVLRGLVEHMLEWCAPHDVRVGDPGQTGVMSVQAEGDGGSLECEVWVEAESHFWGPGPGDFERGDFDLVFKWRTPERDGDWYELGSIIEWADGSPPPVGRGPEASIVL